jgi:heme-degrading monooxygenase HmoA
MILEVATLDVKPGQRDQFQTAFKQAAPIIAGMKGYIAHQLQECVENRQRFLLLVWWQTLEDHTVGFRGSAEYQRWRALLHHFYDPFPTVEHFSLLSGNGTIPQR